MTTRPSSGPLRAGFRRLRSLAPAFVLGFGATSFAASTDGDHLLPDGTFERPDSSGEWPRDWPKGKNVSWETEAGNWFLRLTSTTPGATVSLFREVPLPTGTQAIELSFRRRVSGLVVGDQPWFDARVVLNFKDAIGKKTPAARMPYTQRDTVEWQTVVHRMRVPEGAVAIEFMPSLFRVKAGVFDLDDVVMKAIDPALVP